MKVWIDGEIVPAAEAKVSVLDHGLLYGDGVFEGLRCVSGRVVDLELHMERLELSARSIFLSLPKRSELQDIVVRTLQALACPDAYVRLVATRGTGALGIDTATCETPTVFCVAGQIQLYKQREGGIALATVSLRRPESDVLDPRVKSLNYLNNVLAKHEAKRHGADEALVLNSRGLVAEAAAANIFAVIDGCVCTPALTDGVLGGIVRRRVLKLCERRGIPTSERSLARYDLLRGEEVFLTGSGAGIQPVGCLDGVELGKSRRISMLLLEDTRLYAREHGLVVPGLSCPSQD